LVSRAGWGSPRRRPPEVVLGRSAASIYMVMGFVSRAGWGSPRRRPQVVMGRSADSIYMVMEFVEHDLKGLAESMRQPFTTAEARRAPAQPRTPPWGRHDLKGARGKTAPAAHDRGPAPGPAHTRALRPPGIECAARVTHAQVKCLMQQLLAGVAFLHGTWVPLMRKPTP